jgi:hypothetical protein
MHSPMGSRRGSAGVCDTCGVVVTCDFRPIHFTTRSRVSFAGLRRTLYLYRTRFIFTGVAQLARYFTTVNRVGYLA